MIHTILYVCLCITAFVFYVLFPIVIFLQEKKNFNQISIIRVFLYSIIWISISITQWFLLLPVLLFCSRPYIQVVCHSACQYLARKMHWIFFGKLEIEGLKYLPKDGDEPVIFVANHQTMMDIGCFFHLDGKYAWVSKASVFYVPGAGWLMKLAGYIPLQRRSKESITQLFQSTKEKLKEGWSVTMFPQGTRNGHEILPFKDGAFKMAVENNVSILPITLVIPRDLWTSRSGQCKIIVHPPIKGKNIEELKSKSFNVITESMKKHN